jgi:hypothetical protein
VAAPDRAQQRLERAARLRLRYDELRETLEGSGGPVELAERRMVVQGTLAGLAALPERQRDALLQIAVEGRTQDEVAAELGLTQNAVRQLVHRARTALRGAATAAVPLPLATWLATAGADRGDFAMRVGELVAGAGGTATLAKAGTVAVLAGGAVAGPAVVHDTSERARSGGPASARADTEGDGRDEPVRAAAPAPSGAGGGGDAGAGGQPAGGPTAPRHDGGDGSSRSGAGGSNWGGNDGHQPGATRRRDDDRSGSRHDDDEWHSSGDDDHDRSSGSHRGDDDSSSFRRSGRRGGGDDDEADHGDNEWRRTTGGGGDDDQPAAGGGGDEQDEESQPSQSGGGSAGSGSSSEPDDDEGQVPETPPATPSATPDAGEAGGTEGEPESD